MTSRRTALRSILVGAGCCLLLVGPVAAAKAPDAGATDAADVELTLLHGTNGEKKLPKDFPELQQDPWDKYSHYEIISTKRIPLVKGTPVNEGLPDGWSIEATLLETAPKYKLQLVVKDGKGAQVSSGKYPTAKGARFLPVSFPHKGGRLVVSVKVL